MKTFYRSQRHKEKRTICKIILIAFWSSFFLQGCLTQKKPAHEISDDGKGFFFSLPTKYVSAFQQISPVKSTKNNGGTIFSRSLLKVANEDTDNSSLAPSSSLDFSLSPTSEEARLIVRDNLGLSSEQFQQLAKLAVLVDDWNSNINLISRKDCSPDVVFGRHILPSLAPLAPSMLELSSGESVCDVGTGGGFPGLPLAIARPDVDFLLIDSVGKKITAVQDMADQLGLKNVKTYHGRAESITGKFSWVVGRSVSALPTYCFWIHHLLKESDGRLVYLIGGEIDEDILDEAILDEEIEDLLDFPGVSDKRVLVFPKPAVDLLAEVSGEILKVPKRGHAGRGMDGNVPRDRKNKSDGKNRRKRNNVKGQWKKRDPSAPKERGYGNFKRFDSLDGN